MLRLILPIRNVPLEAEAVEQRLLHLSPLAHHRPNSSHHEKGIGAESRGQAEFFDTIGAKRPLQIATVNVGVGGFPTSKSPGVWAECTRNGYSADCGVGSDFGLGALSERRRHGGIDFLDSGAL